MSFVSVIRVFCVFMTAMIRVRRAAYGTLVRGGVKGVRFHSGQISITVGAVFSMTSGRREKRIVCACMFALTRLTLTTYGAFMRDRVKGVRLYLGQFNATEGTVFEVAFAPKR